MSDETDAKEFSDLLKDAKKAIIATFKDITDISVITAVAEKVSPPAGPLTDMEKLKEAEVEGITYYARTSLQLDGDISTLLPNGPDPKRIEEVTEVHKLATGRAVATWNNMARVAFTGIAIAAGISGHPLKEDVIKLIERFGFVES